MIITGPKFLKNLANNQINKLLERKPMVLDKTKVDVWIKYALELERRVGQ